MFRVLIVDDEVVIRNGLKHIIAWEDYGFEVCGEGINGQDGLEKVEQLRPDLVIADLRMPGLNGLEMIEQIRKKDFKVRIIILTGYEEFEYAKRAINYAVDAYLLKPIEEELIENLAIINTKLHNDKQDGYYTETITMALGKILRGILFQNINEQKINMYNEIYSLNLPWESYQILLIGKDSNDFEASKVEIYKIVEEILDNKCERYLLDINNYIGLIIKDYYFTKTNKLILEQLCLDIKSECDIEIIIAVGQPVKELIDLKKAYQEVVNLFTKQFIYSSENVLYFNEHECNENKQIEDIDIEYIVNKLYMAIDVYEKTYINDLLDRLKTRLITHEMDESTIKVIYVNIYTLIYTKLMNKYSDIIKPITNKVNIISQIYKKETLQALDEYMKDLIYKICEGISVNNPDSLLKRIVYYIDNNYKYDITLSKLADIFGYNSTYLGKRFKKYTGLKFNKYLNNVRIIHAKRLLKEGYKVQDVAKKVGYCDKDYFYLKFKKHEGISPSEYKSS